MAIAPVSADSGTDVAGRFRLREELGAGGMAQVFRATDTQLDRDVAVKLVDLRSDLDGDARARIAREARRAAQLRHPNVVQVHDVGTDEGAAYIVMEHIDGPTLGDVLGRRGRLEEHEIADLGMQICAALDAAHDAGVVHRDVKPDNILLDDGRVKVTDFGIARAVGDTLTDEQVRGTIGYLAPEQIDGGGVDHRADLYSLGVVLYELATGARPFDGATATETAMRRLYEDPPTPSGQAPVSAEFDHVIARALTRDPDERFQTAEELRAALEPLAADPAVDTQPLARATPPSGGSRRRWLTGGVLASLLLLVGWVLVGSQLTGSTSVQVPDVSGSTVGAAASVLDQHGLEVGTVAWRVSDRPPGTVIAQDPPAGADAPHDGSVDLVVAQRPLSSPASPDQEDDQGSTDGTTTDGQPAGGQDGQDGQDQQEVGPPSDRGPDDRGPPGREGDPPGLD